MPRKLKPFDQLSASQQKRISAYARNNGLTIDEVRNNADLREAARGHATTPNTPTQALRDLERYQGYIIKQRRTLQLQDKVKNVSTYREAYKAGIKKIEGKVFDEDFYTLFTVITKELPDHNYTPRITVRSLEDIENYLSTGHIPPSLYLASRTHHPSLTTYTLYLPSSS